MPGPLISRQNISTGAVSSTERRFTSPTGKLKEARVFFSWGVAIAPATIPPIQSMPHGLKAKPTSFTVVASGNSAGTGSPNVFAADPSFWASKNVVALASNMENSWAEVIVR